MAKKGTSSLINSSSGCTKPSMPLGVDAVSTLIAADWTETLESPQIIEFTSAQHPSDR